MRKLNLIALIAISLSAFSQAPTISSFTPASGPVGTLLHITGTNLSNPASLTVGGVPAIVVSTGPTGDTITVLVMPGSVTGAISITTSGGTALSGGNFSVQAIPAPFTQQGPALVPYAGFATVAISADGNTAVVGESGADTSTGAAWIYTRSGNIWSQQAKLAGTGATYITNYGLSAISQGSAVAISADGNTVAVGGLGDNWYVGAVWVFTRSGGVWTQQGPKLVGTGYINEPEQGSSVSLSADGNTLAVGSEYGGLSWIYTRSGGAWTQQQGPLNGVSVALSADGNTAILALNSWASAAVYTVSYGVWAQQGSNLVGTGSVVTLYTNSESSVALSADGNTAIVGEPFDNNDTGAVWIFTRSGGTWIQQGNKLVSPGMKYQGGSVSLTADGNTAFVGGSRDSSGVTAAVVYTRTGGIWAQQGGIREGLNPSDNDWHPNGCISADGSTAMIGGTVQAWIFSSFCTTAYDTLAQSICPGGSYAFGGQNLTAAGTYYDTLTSVFGCDSILVLNLSVGLIHHSLSQSICPGSSYVFGGQTLTAAGTYYDTLTSAGGCDSINILNLTVMSNYGSVLSQNICPGSAYAFGSQNLSAAGTYYDTLTSSLGCDSIVTLHLSLWPAVSSSYSQTICPGSSYTFFEQNLTAAGTYHDTLTSVNGCDSVITLTLTVGSIGSPSITSFSPVSGPPGTLVTIYGSNLEGTTVTIGGVAAIIVSNNGTVLVAMVMPGAVTGTLSVTTCGGTATGPGTFTVLPTPYPCTQQAELMQWGDPAEQGSAVALSADGNTAIVGGPSDNNDTGAIWIYTRSGNSWTQQGPKLRGTGAIQTFQGYVFNGSQYVTEYAISQGASVALSADGNTAIVGGPADNADTGAVWVFTRTNGVWSQQGPKLVGSGAIGSVRQGSAISISADGNTAIVGGASDNNGSGAVWVFTRNGGVWTQQGPKLTDTGSVGAAGLGGSVAISADGNTLIAGGTADNGNTGAVWIFTRSGATWSQQGPKLVGNNYFAGYGGDYQGTSVALSADGNTAIEGSNNDDVWVGAVWVFTRTGGVWSQQGPKLQVNAGECEQASCVSLSADGNTAIVGAPIAGIYNTNGTGSVGGAFIYTRSDTTWTGRGWLTGTGWYGSGTGYAAYPQQGSSVCMAANGTTAISGGPNNFNGTGSAWVFVTGTKYDTINQTICSGDVYTFNGQNLTTPGTYNDTLQAVYGCDSIVVLNLSYGPVYHPFSQRICPGASYVFGGQSLASAGVYRDTLTSPGGCDSVLVLTLSVIPEFRDTLPNQYMCLGHTFQLGTRTLYSPGTYSDTLTAVGGCDSIVTATLNIYTIGIGINENICAGSSYLFGGQSLTSAGFYTDTLVTSGGCDSVVYLNLSVNPVPIIPIAETGVPCFIGSDTLSIAGSYNYPVTWLKNGIPVAIDSQIITTVAGGNGGGNASNQLYYPYGICLDASGNVYVADEYNNRVQMWAPGATFGTTVAGNGTWGSSATNLSDPQGVFVDTAGNIYVADMYNNRIQKWAPGATFGITVAGGNGYGQSANQLGSPSGVFLDQTGNIFIADAGNNRIQKWAPGATSGTTVAGDSTGQGGTTANLLFHPTGVYVDNSGNIFIADQINNRIQKWAPGATSGVTVAGSPTGAAGWFNDSLLNYPSALYLDHQGNIYIADEYNSRVQKWTPGAAIGATVATGNINDATGVCLDNAGNIYVSDYYNNRVLKYAGSSIYIPAAPGIYTASVTNTYGCSAVSNAITIQQHPATAVSHSMCMGSIFTFGGQNLTAAGTYHDTLTSVNGCDSIITLTLTVLPNSTRSISHSICSGSSYNFNGQNLTAAGTYHDTLTSANGCDSIITLTLTVLPSSTRSIAQGICTGSSYNFNGQSLTVSGTYHDTLTSANGCDSIVTLTLTVNSIISTNVSQTICQGGHYAFGGNNISAAGIYTDTLPSVAGCDSIVTLNLAVLPNSGSSFSQNICQGSTYIFGSQNLSSAGIYHDTLTSANGCDSIVTLDLAILPNSGSSFSQNICQGSSYIFGSQNLSNAGIYRDTLTSANGCDSIVTLDLAILPNSGSSFSQSICQGDSVTFGGHSLNATGTYTDTLAAANTCDSIVTLHLTVTQTVLTTLTDTIGHGDSVTVGAHHYAQSGSYTDTLTAASGCDSIVVLNLTVGPDGITQIAGQNTIRLYPNPNNGSFTLVAGKGWQTAGNYTISDILGKVVVEGQIKSDHQIIDIGDAAGVYTLTVKGSQPVRFVVVR